MYFRNYHQLSVTKRIFFHGHTIEIKSQRKILKQNCRKLFNARARHYGTSISSKITHFYMKPLDSKHDIEDITNCQFLPSKNKRKLSKKRVWFFTTAMDCSLEENISSYYMFYNKSKKGRLKKVDFCLVRMTMSKFCCYCATHFGFFLFSAPTKNF